MCSVTDGKDFIAKKKVVDFDAGKIKITSKKPLKISIGIIDLTEADIEAIDENMNSSLFGLLIKTARTDSKEDAKIKVTQLQNNIDQKQREIEHLRKQVHSLEQELSGKRASEAASAPPTPVAVEVAKRKGASLVNPRVRKTAAKKSSGPVFADEEDD